MKLYRLGVLNDSPYNEGMDYWLEMTVKDILAIMKGEWSWMKNRELHIEVIELGKQETKDLTDKLVSGLESQSESEQSESDQSDSERDLESGKSDSERDLESDFGTVDCDLYETFDGPIPEAIYCCKDWSCQVMYEDKVDTCEYCGRDCKLLQVVDGSCYIRAF